MKISKNAAVLLLTMSVSACAADGSEELELADAPTSEIDPASGEPVAMNYEPAPLYTGGIEKNLSTGFQDVQSGTGEEATIDLPRDFLIVGIGARVAPKAVTTLRVQARPHQANGTLGGSFEFRGGTQPDAGLEVWCAAPDGHVISGFGARIADYNMTTMHIWTRPYNAATRTLGPVEQEPRRCGSVPSSGVERRIVTWEHGSQADLNRTVINGVGMREDSDNLAGMRARLRVVQ